MKFFIYIIFVSLGIIEIKSQINYNVNLSGKYVLISNIQGVDSNYYTYIEVEGLQESNKIGKPLLPELYLKFIIPQEQSVDSIIVVDTTVGQIYNLENKVLPTQGYNEDEFIVPDTTIYNSTYPYPEKMFEVVRHDFFDGNNRIVTIKYCPFKYFPKEDSLIFYSNSDIILQFKYSGEMGANPGGRIESIQKIYDSILENMVVNPEDIILYGNVAPMVIKADSTKQPGPVLSYNYTIITNKELAPAFEKLVQWKKKKIENVGVVTLDKIYKYYYNNEFDEIHDSAGAIRAFLFDTYHDPYGYAPVYVLLVGDYSVVPIRYGCSENSNSINNLSDDEIIPADLYFADLYGDWNVDGDNCFGEPNDDKVDYLPEIFVGRLLCTDLKEVERWVDKVILYETDPGNGNTDYLVNSFISQADQYQQLNHANAIKNKLTMFSHVVMQENDIYNPTSPYSEDVMEQIKMGGYGLISFLAHSDARSITTMSKNLNRTPRNCINSIDSYEGNEIPEDKDAFDRFRNYNKPAIVYATGCRNLAFDDNRTSFGIENLAEAFTVMTDAGGVNFLGYTRIGNFQPTRYVYERFCDALTMSNNNDYENMNHIGVAYTYSKTFAAHYENLSHNLIGCPETRIWLDIPHYFNNVKIDCKENSISVDAGVDGCIICVVNADGWHMKQYDVRVANFDEFYTIKYPVDIYITKKDYIPYIKENINIITLKTKVYLQGAYR
ncbi:MAG: hypothetical protein JW866_09095 [Ignavibacteriales bacterium]|nr:hypothetical protein [Ignavibacteriales bacterium]